MIPRDSHFDSSVALLRDPYRYVGRRCSELGCDAFAGRLLLRPTIFGRGAEAARLFYDVDKFQRSNAFPRPIRRTLIGEGGVQTLDGERHRRRKAMFLSLMSRDSVARLAQLFVREWEKAAAGWQGREEILLYEELHPLLTRAVCSWAGVPLEEQDVSRRAGQLRALFDYAGAKGPMHVRSRIARRQTEKWLARIVREVRSGALRVPEDSPAAVIARFDEAGGPLTPRVAAVEILNVLRPTVAVAAYIIFIAHALESYPEQRPTGPEAASDFIEEVRRFYPFFPSLAALARRDFEWRGHRIKRGCQFVLDLFGTNHDPGLWGDPDVFRPGRFTAWDDRPYAFIPQGGGAHDNGHRCPGEWITRALMEEALRLLQHRMDYSVPEQDLGLDFRRLPALPGSRMILSRVRMG
jgi:fatty-acid peroxygenase